MSKTHLSLYYLIGYLIPAGLALILLPEFAMRLLLSNGSYGDVLPRLLGVVLLALGIVILQIVRHRLEVLYSTTLLVRGLILAVLISLFVYSRDPFFLSLTVIVGLGVVLTGISYYLDRRAKLGMAAQ